MFPTEDFQKISVALSNLFPNIAIDFATSQPEDEILINISGEESVAFLRQYIHEARIIDAVRKKLVSNWTGSETKIHLDKQSAFIGKLRLIDEADDVSLGTIETKLIFEDDVEFEKFLLWFVPPTKDGRVVRH
ncbi:MAG: RNA-binding domain-containing protein [Candidatus Thorarchaeota archaeon]